MKNRQMLSLLSLTVLCAMAFTATAVFAQGFNLQEAQQRAEERRRLINENCPADAMVAAVNAYISAAEAVEHAQNLYDQTLASGSLHLITSAGITLSTAKRIAAQRLAEARAAVAARNACINSVLANSQ